MKRTGTFAGALAATILAALPSIAQIRASASGDFAYYPHTEVERALSRAYQSLANVSIDSCVYGDARAAHQRLQNEYERLSAAAAAALGRPIYDEAIRTISDCRAPFNRNRLERNIAATSQHLSQANELLHRGRLN